MVVTGAAGYVGSHLVRLLAEKGARVIALDDFSEGHHQALPSDVELFEGDVREPDVVTRIFAAHQVDAVVHLAARCGSSESLQNPEKYYSNNLSGTLTVLRGAVDFDVRRFLFASDAVVYGRPRTPVVSETVTPAPLSPYARSKALVEALLPDYWRAYGLQTVALRLFTVAGAFPEAGVGESHRIERHLVPSVFKVALGQKESLAVHGTDLPTSDGTAVRDYVHVRDVCRAFSAALEAPVDEPTTLNIGSGRGHSVMEVLKEAEKVTGAKIKWEAGPRLPLEPHRLVADIDAASQRLDWHPEHSDLPQILSDGWAWQKEHPHGYVAEQKDARRLFGRTLLELGIATPGQLKEALRLQKEQDARGEHKLLGVVMLEAGMITPGELIRALRELQKRGVEEGG